jgi:hypothetical protein
MAAKLAAGARQLPVHHITMHVPWHDRGWSGSICANPQSRHRGGHRVRRYSREAVVRWRALGAKRTCGANLPVKRVVSPTRSPEDIAAPAVLLASDYHGHIIMADGG